MIKKAKIVNKLWGNELIYAREKEYAGKILTLNRGYQSSLHYHSNKTETFFCLLGEIEIEIRNLNHTRKYILRMGDCIKIIPTILHRFKATSEVAYMLEVSTEDCDYDNYRVENSAQELSVASNATFKEVKEKVRTYLNSAKDKGFVASDWKRKTKNIKVKIVNKKRPAKKNKKITILKLTANK